MSDVVFDPAISSWVSNVSGRWAFARLASGSVSEASGKGSKADRPCIVTVSNEDSSEVFVNADR